MSSFAISFANSPVVVIVARRVSPGCNSSFCKFNVGSAEAQAMLIKNNKANIKPLLIIKEEKKN